MIISKFYDVEVLPNYFGITIIDVSSYLNIFKDCVDAKGNPIPIVQKLSVKELKERLDKVQYDSYYITDKDDTQLLDMLGKINSFKHYYKENKELVRTDMFGYNSLNYDKLMVAALLMHATNCNNSKELCTKLYDTSKKIIDLQDNKDEFRRDFYLNTLKNYNLPYIDIDVMQIFALNKVGKGVNAKGEPVFFSKGLKQTSINLQWYELLEYELPPISEKDVDLYTSKSKYKNFTIEQLNNLINKWDRYIIDEWIPDMSHYNKNDCFIGCELMRLNMDEIKSRYAITNVYKTNVLNSSRSNIADVLFEKFYSEFSNLPPSQWKGKKTERTKMAFKRIIFPWIEFKTEPLKKLLNDMKEVVITNLGKDSFLREITINNLTYTVATGGLHSQDIPRELISNLSFTGDWELSKTSSVDKQSDVSVWDVIDDKAYIYVHFDISSFYPSIMVEHKVSPAHLNSGVFCNLIRWLRDTRINAKHSKEDYIDGIPKNILALVLKIVINSIYGKLGYSYGELYDRLAVLNVTINGQLMILMLCEELELNGIEVMSANTDGIVVKLYKKDKPVFDSITDNWMKLTKFGADSEEYKCYINRDINNYCIEELNGKRTYKGAMNPKMYLADLSKGYDMPIVAQAVENYFLNNKPVLETLYESTNILDFCKTQNIGRQFHIEIPETVNGINYVEYQRYVRYYVSTYGTDIFKVHNNLKTRSKLCAGQKVKILNTLDDTKIELRNIDYNYYYKECYKIINPIKQNMKAKAKNKKILERNTENYKSLFDDNI